MREQTLKGVVTALLPEGMAKVMPYGDNRRGDCAACGGCGERKPVTARNTPGARPGDSVTLSVRRRHPVSAALFRIALPIGAFAAAFFAVSLFSSGEGIAIGAGILFGVGLGVWSERRKDRHLEYEIRTVNE